MKLTIVRIKPNPAGKDRSRHAAPSPAQLAAEWVDLRNDTGRDVSLNNVSLWHLAYARGRRPEWKKITPFSGTLPTGMIVRVHSGKRRELSVIHPNDLAGANYHVFTGEDTYVWNNKEGDTPMLFNDVRKEIVDKASYDPNPPEGAVLVRLGDKLTANVAARAANW